MQKTVYDRFHYENPKGDWESRNEKYQWPRHVVEWQDAPLRLVRKLHGDIPVLNKTDELIMQSYADTTCLFAGQSHGEVVAPHVHFGHFQKLLAETKLEVIHNP